MLSFNTNSCLLALAALPCLLQVTLATPSGVRARNSEETLFRAGGTSLDDIAVPKSVADGRSEASLIFAQGLIAMRKLNPKAINLLFGEYDGNSGIITDEATLTPYYMDAERLKSEDRSLKVTFQDAKDTAAERKMEFGFTDKAAWWPYALFKGVLKAGWGQYKDQDLTLESSDEKEEIKQELAEQTLSLLSGQNAKCEKPDKIATFFGDDQKQNSNLAKADETPILLEIAEFDTEKHPDLKDKRWEKWVTAMSYDQSTMMLDYATSFYDEGDEGITVHAVNVTEITVLSVAFLDGWSTVGERAPDHQESSIPAPAGAAPTP